MEYQYSTYFEEGLNAKGEAYVKLVDKAPQELKDLVLDISCDVLEDYTPICSDWVCETIRDAFEDLEQNPLENCSIEADVYTKDLIKWFSEESFAVEFCNRAMIERGVKKGDIIEMIQYGQTLAKDTIYQEVCAFLDRQRDANAKIFFNADL